MKTLALVRTEGPQVKVIVVVVVVVGLDVVVGAVDVAHAAGVDVVVVVV